MFDNYLVQSLIVLGPVSIIIGLLLKRFAPKSNITWKRSITLNSLGCFVGLLACTLVLSLLFHDTEINPVGLKGYFGFVLFTTVLSLIYGLLPLVFSTALFTLILKWRRAFYMPVALSTATGATVPLVAILVLISLPY